MIRWGLGVNNSSHSSVPDAGSGLVSRTDKHTRLLRPSEVVSVVTLPAMWVHMEDRESETIEFLSGDDSLLDGKSADAGAEDETGVIRTGRCSSYSSSEICEGRKMGPLRCFSLLKRFSGCGLSSSSNVMERICWRRSSMLLSSEDVVETDCGVPFEGLTPRRLDLGLLRPVGVEKIFLKPCMLSYSYCLVWYVKSEQLRILIRMHLYLPVKRSVLCSLETRLQDVDSNVPSSYIPILNVLQFVSQFAMHTSKQRSFHRLCITSFYLERDTCISMDGVFR
jgi:hypothetical protein